jgi:predicted transposase/invertase (TIGR01784 family)
MKKQLVPTPHDRFFRASMADPRVATQFFETHLPDAIKKQVNLNTLHMEPGTFIDEELQLQVTDVLFSVEYQGRPGYIYNLVEHQRTPDPLMAFRSLKYRLKIMEQHYKKYGELPIVYVVVLYNGKVRYPYSTDFFDLFGEHKALAQQLFSPAFELVDLSQIADKELRRKAWLGMMELSLKHVDERDLLPFIRGVVTLLQEIEQAGGIDYIKTIFHYLFTSGEISDTEALVEVLHQNLSPALESTVMTIAQQFEQKGMEKGRREVAIQLIKEKLLPDEQIARVAHLSLETIQALKRQVKTH